LGSGFPYPFEGSLFESLKKGIQYGMYSIQIFLGSPKAYKRAPVTVQDLEVTHKLLQRYPMNFFIHTPYMFNLAGSKKIRAWDGDAKQDHITQNVIEAISQNLSSIRTGVIVHPGNHIDTERGLEAISETINKIEFTGTSKLLLENSSGGGTSLATTFEEIRCIIEGIDEDKRKHVGVCVDTAHIFGYGSYDLRREEEVDRMFLEFDEIIGADKFCLLHLNDSQNSEDKRYNAPFGSKKDRHQLLGHGYIWQDNMEALAYLLERCRERNIPIILETHPCDMGTLVELAKF
jgi:apurinic endonuclease APN1